MDLGGPRRCLDSSSLAPGAETQVLADGDIEEIGLLRHDADGRSERAEGQLAHVDAVDLDRALRRVVEPSDEVAGGRLPGAGFADQSGLRSRCRLEGDILQRPVLAVAEPDVVERDTPLGPRQRTRPLLDVDVQVEVLEDAVEQRQGGLDVERDAEEGADREEEPRLQGGERDERGQRDRAREMAGEEIDERRHDREGHLDRAHHPAARHPASHLEVGELRRLVLESGRELPDRPIVLPSRIPETESDSWTRLEMSAIDSWRTFATA